MKQILTILLCSILSSCGYAIIDSTNNECIPIITKIEKVDSITCDYCGIGNPTVAFTVTEWEFKFRDTVGKFQIGDTINIIKKINYDIN